MGEWINSITSNPQGQFLLGVLVLVFGSQAILSEHNMKGKLWGVGAPLRWWRKRQQETAEKELSELVRLREENHQLHRYIVWITGIQRKIEIWAVDKGYELPPPPFNTYHEWKEENDKRA